MSYIPRDDHAAQLVDDQHVELRRRLTELLLQDLRMGSITRGVSLRATAMWPSARMVWSGIRWASLVAGGGGGYPPARGGGHQHPRPALEVGGGGGRGVLLVVPRGVGEERGGAGGGRGVYLGGGRTFKKQKRHK